MLSKLLISLLCGFGSALATGLVTLPMAYTERGYFAFGGEWLLTIFVGVLVSYAVWDELK